MKTKELIYKTFDEWSKNGYKIIKGSKSVRLGGLNKFSNNQVIKIRTKCRDIGEDPDETYHDEWDLDFYDSMSFGDR